jgi:precorrin-2 dehydrogenase/sirohydrochlorin ferrochelatase
MIPISLDPAMLRLALAGRGEAARRRLAALRAAGARHLVWFCEAAAPADFALGVPIEPRLPTADDLARLHGLWIAGLPAEVAAGLAGAARAARVLVNAEDMPALCDFHSVAEIRRGALLLTVSTGGQSPALASLLRADLERRYGPEWGGHLARLGRLRRRWRRLGVAGAEMAARTGRLVARRGWLA